MTRARMTRTKGGARVDIQSEWRDADAGDWARIWGLPVADARAKIQDIVAQDEAAMRAAADYINGGAE